ncbi:MAG: aminotransferase class IV [Pelagibacteraceae bacterium]|nr:aminotransferase class IV [Pelagibacteraceae bacterium]MBT4645605.1 aminotransferase class IV [Pelagibacteraceae bacterium]MBT6198379.1 aminotransferase class IV [Pelagibacteraceae bacterium]
MPSSHDFIKDKRNKNIKIYINGKFFIREKAKISVFDSSILLGDGIWSGIRFHNNNFLFLKDHLNRLFDDAKKISLKIHLTKKQISKILFDTIKINKMKTDVHLRLIISRGIKSTPYQDPVFTISKPTIIIIPEYKQPQESIYKKGLVLKTVKTIRGPHNVQDPRINSLSKLNCILACIEAKKQKADEALMFDIKGNIATNNSTHFFYVKENCVYTSTGKYCVKGITRQKVIDLCKKNKIKVKEIDFKLKDVLKADESFVTGTFANIIPVKKINSKKFNLKKNIITNKLRNLYLELMEKN